MKKLIIIFTILLLSHKNLFSQEVEGNYVKSDSIYKPGLKLILNSDFTKSNNDKDIAEFYSLFIDFNTNKDLWNKVSVTSGSNISNIINKNYRIYQNPSEGYNKTYKLIEDTIVKFSNIYNKDSINIGDTLYLPVLPVRGYSGRY